MNKMASKITSRQKNPFRKYPGLFWDEIYGAFRFNVRILSSQANSLRVNY